MWRNSQTNEMCVCVFVVLFCLNILIILLLRLSTVSVRVQILMGIIWTFRPVDMKLFLMLQEIIMYWIQFPRPSLSFPHLLHPSHYHSHPQCHPYPCPDLSTHYQITRSVPASLRPLITSSISLSTSKISYLSPTENHNLYHPASSLGLFTTHFKMALMLASEEDRP